MQVSISGCLAEPAQPSHVPSACFGKQAVGASLSVRERPALIFSGALLQLKRAAARLLALLLGCLPCVSVANEAGTALSYTRLEPFQLRSADAQRDYQVEILRPQRAAPEQGYPVLYLLDGKAALAALDERWLAELGAGNPPLLVFIGHAGERSFNVPARTVDYTPGRFDGQAMQAFNGVQGGGAAQFLALLEQQIKPQVAALQPVDPRQQAIWGHSFGGLFVLNTLFTQPASFTRYIAASPSLWWQSGLLLEIEQGFTGAAAQVLILRGSDEGLPGQTRPGVDPAVLAQRRQAMAAVGPDAARQMATRLAQSAALQVRYQEFAGLAHGPMLAASLRPALRMAAGLPEESAHE